MSTTNDKVSVYGINNASVLRRFAAFLIDFIILIVLATGISSLTSIIVKYDENYSKLEEHYLEHGVISPNPEAVEGEDPYISCEIQYDANGDMVDNDPCYNSWQAFYNDDEGVALSNKCDTLMIIILTTGCLAGLLLSEFLVPLIFKNGQTLGKKIMHIGVIGHDGIRIRTWMLFARVIIGRFAIETMIPLYCVIFAFLNPSGGLAGIIIIFVICTMELVCVGFTKNHSALHDLVSNTIVIDIDSQYIPYNKEEREKHILETSKNK